MQDVIPLEFGDEYLPAGQKSHVDPATAAYFPAAQIEHVVPDELLPLGHKVQSLMLS